MKNEPDKNYKPYGEMDIELGAPPPCYLSMQARLLDYSPEKGLTVAVPVLESELNPAGSMQGGLIAAAFDNVFGPLCYLASGTPRTAMVDIYTVFHRPVFAGDELVINARVKTMGRRTIHMEAEAYNRENKLVASASCNYMRLME